MPRNRQPAIPVYEPRDETAVVHKPHPARFGAPARAAARRPMSTTFASRRARCTSPSAWPTRRCGALRGLDLSAVRAADGVVAVLTAADIPGKNDIAPVFADEPLFADKEILFHGQALFAVVGAHPRRGAPRRAARQDRHRGKARRRSPIDDALETGARVLPDYAFGRGDVERALAAAPHRLEGELAHRRPGAFLSRRPGVARHSRRRRRDDGALLDAGSDRGAAYRRARSRPAGRVRHRRDAAHGRRLRRQGEPGLRLGGDRGARRARDGRAVQDAARPRRRFHAHRQAPRFPRRLARSATTTRAVSASTTSCSTRAAAARPTCRPASSTARCSTPATPTGCPTSTSPRAA